MAKYNMIIVPEGSPIPEDLVALAVSGDDVIAKIAACTGPLHIVPVNTRELQLIVEYRDLFDLDTRAVIGLQGAMYSTVWNTYVATMDRVTLENVRALLKDRNDNSSRSGSEAIIHPTRAQRLARFETRQPEQSSEEPQNEQDFSEDGNA